VEMSEVIRERRTAIGHVPARPRHGSRGRCPADPALRGRRAAAAAVSGHRHRRRARDHGRRVGGPAVTPSQARRDVVGVLADRPHRRREDRLPAGRDQARRRPDAGRHDHPRPARRGRRLPLERRASPMGQRTPDGLVRGQRGLDPVQGHHVLRAAPARADHVRPLGGPRLRRADHDRVGGHGPDPGRSRGHHAKADRQRGSALRR
jgi:hypothetical protein